MIVLSDGKFVDASQVSAESFSVLSKDRLRILRALAEKPQYPAQLSRSLGIQQQTAYYHVRLLAEAGLISVEDYEEKGGALAKRYSVKADALALVLRGDWKPFRDRTGKPPSFLAPFINRGTLDARLVIGSPEPHGKYRARASEFCVAELGAWLGSFAAVKHPFYYLDTELDEARKRESLFVVGGPKVNTFLSEINSSLPIRFKANSFEVYSSLSKKSYAEEVGVIQCVPNPFNESKQLFVVAGSRHHGTRVAALALKREAKKLAKNNLFDSSVFARVVQGFDEDGDGVVDEVEILE